MRSPLRVLCLLLLLLTAQQGAVVHELSHYTPPQAVHLGAKTGGGVEGACALCPVYAQALTPAFSHALEFPAARRVAADRIVEHRIELVFAASPTPRSRGPPTSS